MSRHLIPWSVIALLALWFVPNASGAAPPLVYKLTEDDRQFLCGLKAFLFDPIGAQWVTIRMIPANVERMGWLTAIKADGTAKVHFADGESTSVPVQLVTPIDFITSCKEFVQPTSKRLKAEPIDPIETPGQGFMTFRAGADKSSLVLAAWLYGLGQESLAARALARVSDRRRVLTELRRYLAWSAYSTLLYRFTMRADEEALDHGERLLRLYSNEAAQMHPQGRTIVDDLKRRKRKGTFGGKLAKLPENFGRWEVKKRITYLIDALEEVDERYWHQNAGFSLESDPRVAALIAIGEPAVPALIDVIEKDKRLTRRSRPTEGPLRPQSILPVREVALVTVESILRFETPLTYFTRASFTNGDEESAREVARQLRAYWNRYSKLPVSVRRTPCRSGREAVMARTRHHPTKGTAGTSDSSLVGWDGATMEGASSGR